MSLLKKTVYSCLSQQHLCLSHIYFSIISCETTGLSVLNLALFSAPLRVLKVKTEITVCVHVFFSALEGYRGCSIIEMTT